MFFSKITILEYASPRLAKKSARSNPKALVTYYKFLGITIYKRIVLEH